MELGFDRLQHSLAVARKMRLIVAASPTAYDITPEEAFYLGLIHDAAYEIVERQEDHEHKGGLILKNDGYKYWAEVYYHGDPDADYSSPILDLLNKTDLSTGPKGEDVTIEERLRDIGERYSTESVQYIKAKRLAERFL